MAAVVITPEDLTPFATIPEAKAQAMIDDALALAARVAPCILSDTFEHAGAAKAVLRGAILRWNDAGTGALQSERVDDYQVTLDTRYPASRGVFYPSEIEELQDMCRSGAPGDAFSVTLLPTPGYRAGSVWTDSLP